MSQLVIKDLLYSNEKIAAIKCLRSIAPTGLGLKEAKDAIDNLPGTPYIINNANTSVKLLAEQDFVCELIDTSDDIPDLDVNIMHDWLYAFPPHLTVSDVQGILKNIPQIIIKPGFTTPKISEVS